MGDEKFSMGAKVTELESRLVLLEDQMDDLRAAMDVDTECPRLHEVLRGKFVPADDDFISCQRGAGTIDMPS